MIRGPGSPCSALRTNCCAWKCQKIIDWRLYHRETTLSKPGTWNTTELPHTMSWWAATTCTYAFTNGFSNHWWSRSEENNNRHGNTDSTMDLRAMESENRLDKRSISISTFWASSFYSWETASCCTSKVKFPRSDQILQQSLELRDRYRSIRDLGRTCRTNEDCSTTRTGAAGPKDQGSRVGVSHAEEFKSDNATIILLLLDVLI